MVLSRNKIDQIVTEVTKPLQEKINSISEKIDKKATDYIVKTYIPKNIMEAFSEYPKAFNWGQNFYYLFAQISKPIYLKIPNPETFGATRVKLMEDVGLADEILDLCLEWKTLITKRDSTKGKLTCLLTELHTDAKLKKELPDVYEVFLKIQKMPSTSLCDSVESVQAELEDIKAITKRAEIKPDLTAYVVSHTHRGYNILKLDVGGYLVQDNSTLEVLAETSGDGMVFKTLVDCKIKINSIIIENQE